MHPTNTPARVFTNVTHEEKKQLQRYALDHNTTMTDILRTFVRELLGNHHTTQETK